MSTSSLMNLGTKALFAAYSQLQTTSNNIANANTPGYSRQSVQLATAGSAYSGSGYMGRGVTVATVTRASNMYLSSQALATGSAAAADGVRRGLLGQLEKVFAGGANGLGSAATQIFNAFADVAANPSDLSARQAVLGRLADFASLGRSSSDQIESLQIQLVHDVTVGVAEVNKLAGELAKLNTNIAAATSRGHKPNDLLDQRDELVRKIGNQVEVHSLIGPDETASLFVGSGQTLVLGQSAHRLQVQTDPFDASRVALGVNIGGQLTPLTTEAVGQGLIGGMMRFQDQDLAEARNRLGQIVVGLGTALNQQQALGLDLAGSAGSPLLQFGTPLALAAAGNARDSSGMPISGVTLSVSDASKLKASDYLLQGEPGINGRFSVTRLSDGQVFQSVASGDQIDGLSIELDSNGLEPGDRFTLKGVSQAAASLNLALKSPQGLAAASAVTGLVHPANVGNARIAALDIDSLPVGGFQAITLEFSNDAGNYELFDASGTRLGDGIYQAGQPIRVDGIALSLNGLPRSGDRLLLAPTTQAASSNGNALRFDRMAELKLIDGQSAGDAYAYAMADVGVRMQGATAAADNSTAVASRAQTELKSTVGVNLDEEAARLIQFQQSYQAAAKMLQTAQTMFDAVLNLSR